MPGPRYDCGLSLRLENGHHKIFLASNYPCVGHLRAGGGKSGESRQTTETTLTLYSHDDTRHSTLSQWPGPQAPAAPAPTPAPRTDS